MKSKKEWIGTFIAAVFVLTVFAVSSVSAQSLTNGDFETGDITGWTVSVPLGGTAQVVTSHTGSSTTYNPINGVFFAELKTDGAGSYTTLTQNVYMSAGATIEGWAAFDCRDYSGYNDNAYVKIDGTTLWSRSVAGVGPYADDPWAHWSWTAPASGTYTLKLGIANGGDSGYDSYALFDYVVLTDSVIPEFSTIAIPVASILGLLFFFNYRKRRKE